MRPVPDPAFFLLCNAALLLMTALVCVWRQSPPEEKVPPLPAPPPPPFSPLAGALLSLLRDATWRAKHSDGQTPCLSHADPYGRTTRAYLVGQGGWDFSFEHERLGRLLSGPEKAALSLAADAALARSFASRNQHLAGLVAPRKPSA